MKKREKVIIKTSIIGIIGNIILVLFKAFIGFLANSVSIIMDALNNLTDALSSVITIIGTKLANKPSNKKHPYGYGRIEYITSTLIAILILFAGGAAIYESILSIIDHFKYGTMPKFETYSIIIISIAIIIKILIGLYFRYQGNKVDSESLKASGLDALFDSILSLSTLVAMIFAITLDIYVEGYLGIIIGLFILKSGFSVLIESLSGMIGERFDREYILNIKNDINKMPNVLGAYDLVLNSYGPNKNIGSVHISVLDTLSAKEIQAIERDIAILAKEKYNLLLTVGIYAENTLDQNIKEMKQYLNNILKDYPNVLQNHGFYIDYDKSICNFDLVISFDETKPYDVIDNVKNKMKDKFDKYEFLIQFDQDFSLSE